MVVLTHDLLPADPPPAIIPFIAYRFKRLIVQSRTQFQTRERKHYCDLFQRCERPVQIQRDVISSSHNGAFSGIAVMLREFEEEVLRVSAAEVKGGCFEHQALEADCVARGVVEDLLCFV